MTARVTQAPIAIEVILVFPESLGISWLGDSTDFFTFFLSRFLCGRSSFSALSIPVMSRAFDTVFQFKDYLVPSWSALVENCKTRPHGSSVSGAGGPGNRVKCKEERIYSEGSKTCERGFTCAQKVKWTIKQMSE